MGDTTRKQGLPVQPEPGSTRPGRTDADVAEAAGPGTRAPGLDEGNSVYPGDTPPTEDSMSGAVGDLHGTPNHGPVSGNRTPMVITLVLVGVIVVAFIAYGIAEAIGYGRL